MEKCRVNMHGLIARQKAEPNNTRLDVDIQNADSQILMARRGSVAMAVSIVYLYYRLGWDSPEIAQELGILPPLVRQTLARLHNAAEGKTYVSPKYRRIKEARAEMKRVRNLFRKLKKIVDATERHATEEELKAILAGAVPGQREPGRAWTLARVRFVYIMRLQKKDWNWIAKRLGVKLGDSVRQGYGWYMKNLHLLPDFKRS